jgi:hypothetical protein
LHRTNCLVIEQFNYFACRRQDDESAQPLIHLLLICLQFLSNPFKPFAEAFSELLGLSHDRSSGVLNPFADQFSEDCDHNAKLLRILRRDIVVVENNSSGRFSSQHIKAYGQVNSAVSGISEIFGHTSYKSSANNELLAALRTRAVR